MSKIIIEPTWPEGGSFPVIDGKSYVSIIDARRVMDAEVEKARNAALEECAEVAEKYQGKAIIQFYDRGPGDPPGNQMRAAEPKDVAAALRALKSPEGGKE